MYVVIVDFDIDPAHWDAFRSLMAEQAANSLARESDCHVFSVHEDLETPHRIFLYEVYTDAAAFDAHLASDHFKTFDAAVAPMVTAKTVRRLTRTSAD